MPEQESLLSLVRNTARAFAAQHRERLDQVEAEHELTLPKAVLDGCAELGWLDELAEPDAPGLGGDVQGMDGNVDAVEASVLGVLVFELGRVSPTLGTRLLCHHYARRWRLALRRADAISQDNSGEVAASRWLSIAPFDPIDHTWPATRRIRSLREGRLPLILGGVESETLLCRAETQAGRESFLELSLTPPVRLRAIRTLGLRGLAVTDVEWSPSAPPAYSLISEDRDEINRAQEAALAFVVPAHLALCRALLATCHETASVYANTRRQGGGLLIELPQVREKLRVLSRNILLFEILERAPEAASPKATILLAHARRALLESTDVGLQILGGAGYIVGSGQERLWRDARQVASLFGSNLGNLA